MKKNKINEEVQNTRSKRHKKTNNKLIATEINNNNISRSYGKDSVNSK